MRVDAPHPCAQRGTVAERLVLDEDTVIDPTGGKILLGAAFVAEFTGDKISAFRNYFDDASLLEQMVAV